MRRADEALVLKMRRSEVEEQPPPDSARGEIVDYLCFLPNRKTVQRLELDKNRSETNKVSTIPHPKGHILVVNRHLHFACTRDSSQAQFHFQGSLIRWFEESRTQRSVYLHRGADDLVRLDVPNPTRAIRLVHLCNLWSPGRAHGTRQSHHGPESRALRLAGPLPEKRHRPAERRPAAFELPGETPHDAPRVLQLRRVDLPAEVLDVHAVLREERVMGELVGGVGEHPVHRLLAPEPGLRRRSEERRV